MALVNSRENMSVNYDAGRMMKQSVCDMLHTVQLRQTTQQQPFSRWQKNKNKT